MSNGNNSKFYIVFIFVILTLIFSIPLLVLPFSSVFATSSNSDNDSEESRDDSNQSDGNESNSDTISSSDDDEQQQESTLNEDSDENSINDIGQSSTEPQNTTTDSSQGLALQDNNQIPPNTLSGNIGMQEQPLDNTVLTSDFSNTVVPIKPDPNLENSPGNLKVIMNVECKSTNGLPSDKAVCDMFTIEPEFIQPKDYSLILAVARDGASYESTFSGDSEDQTFTIKPGDFEISGVLHRDANDVVAKIGAYSQLNSVNLASSTSGDCNLVNIPPGNVYGEVKVKGAILPLTDSTCTINVQVNYYNIELPKSSFGDMLQNQRMPDEVSPN